MSNRPGPAPTKAPPPPATAAPKLPVADAKDAKAHAPHRAPPTAPGTTAAAATSSPPVRTPPAAPSTASPGSRAASPTPSAHPSTTGPRASGQLAKSPIGGGKTDSAPPPPSAPPPTDGEESDEEDDDDDDDDDAEEADADAPGPPVDENVDAAQLMKSLNTPSTLAVKDVLTVKGLLAQPGRTWKNEFVQGDGLEAFANLLAKNSPLPRAAADEIRLEVLNCLEAFLGSAEPAAWLTPMLYSDKLLPNICSHVGSTQPKLKLKAVQLLTVICWINSDGRKSVFAALDNVANDGFHGLPRIIQDLKHLDPKTAEQITNSMILVNSLINSAAELEERLAARKRMRELGLFQVVDKLNEVVEDSPSEEKYHELHAQLDEYDTCLLRDQRETLRDGIDLSDPDAVFTYLKKSVSEDGFGAQFLNILQALMTVPSDKEAGEKMWDNCAHIVSMAVTNDRRDGERRVISFDKLKEALRKKEEESDKAAGNRLKELEEKLEKQRSDLHQMTMKARYADELKEKLAVASAQLVHLKEAKTRAGPPQKSPPAAPKTAGGGGGGGGGDGASSAELDALKATISEKDERIKSLEAQLGITSAPAVDEGPPPDAPPMDDVPAAPDMGDDAPPPPPMDDVPDCPPDMDGDGPVAPKASSNNSGLPKKRVIKPTIKIKKFHWQKVTDNMVKESVWFTLNDDEIKFDTRDFEETFAQKEGPAKSEEKSEEKEKKKKTEVVKLIDEKRSYNTDITLARFRMTNSHIRDSILSMDEIALDQDKLMQLIKIAPTPEEIELVSSYTGDVNVLGNTEKFLRCIASIARIQRRLEFMLFKQQFKGIYDGFKTNTNAVADALTQIRNSKGLRKVLTITLAFGNYMNGNTPKGGAWGFKIRALNTLQSSKSVDNQSSLLHYIVEYVNKNTPKTKEFMEEVKAVHDAARVESLFLSGEVGKVVGIVERIEVELQRSEESIIDRFVPVMREFYSKASKKITKINTKLKKTVDDYNDLLKFFAIGADEKMQWEDFFLIFDRFIKSYQSAEKELDEIKAKKAKQAKMDAYKEKMAKEQEEKKKAKGDTGGLLGKKKKKKKKALVDRVMTSLRNRRDSEFIRMQMLGQVDKEKKIKKRRKKKVKGEGDDDPRGRGASVKGMFGRKATTTGKKKKGTTKKGKSEKELADSIAEQVGL